MVGTWACVTRSQRSRNENECRFLCSFLSTRTETPGVGGIELQLAWLPALMAMLGNELSEACCEPTTPFFVERKACL